MHEAVEPAPNDPDDRSTGWSTGTGIPCSIGTAPIRDHYAYNGGDLGTDNVVTDLSLEARLTSARTSR